MHINSEISLLRSGAIVQGNGAQPWVTQMFFDCNSQKSWPAQLVVKAYGNCSLRTRVTQGWGQLEDCIRAP